MIPMKPDWTYIDSEEDIEQFIKGSISELETLCPLEKSFDDKESFEQISHAKFALKMLLQEIHEHSSVSACAIIESFARKMDDYSNGNVETSYVFSVAHETAQNLLNIIGEYS